MIRRLFFRRAIEQTAGAVMAPFVAKPSPPPQTAMRVTTLNIAHDTTKLRDATREMVEAIRAMGTATEAAKAKIVNLVEASSHSV